MATHSLDIAETFRRDTCSENLLNVGTEEKINSSLYWSTIGPSLYVFRINLVFFSFAFLCVFTSVLVHMHVCPRRSEVNLGCFFFFFSQEPSLFFFSETGSFRTGSSQLLLGQ